MQTMLNPTVMHGRTQRNVARLAFWLTAIVFLTFALTTIDARAILYNVVREQTKKVFAYQTSGLLEQESEHFTVRYREADAAYAGLVLATAESIYKPVCADLGYNPAGKTLIVIYPDREELNGSFGWSSQASAMGVYWAGSIRLLSPDEWLKESDPELLAAAFRRHGPIAHEFAHLLLDYRTNGNYPRWFTEGIAQYQEYRLTGEVWAELKGDVDCYSLAELEAAFDGLPDQDLAYYQSFLLVEYLTEKYGADGLETIITALAAGQKLPRAIETVTGLTYPEFEQEWLKWSADNEKFGTD